MDTFQTHPSLSTAQLKHVSEAWTPSPAHPLAAVLDFPALPCLPCALASRGRRQVLGSPGEKMVLGGSWALLALLGYWEMVALEAELSPRDRQDPRHHRSSGRTASACSSDPSTPAGVPLWAGKQHCTPFHRQVCHLHRCQQVLGAPPSQASPAAPARQDEGINEPPLLGCRQASSRSWCLCLNPEDPPKSPQNSQEPLRAVHHHHCSNQPPLNRHAQASPSPSSHLWAWRARVSVRSRFSQRALWKCLGRRCQSKG